MEYQVDGESITPAKLEADSRWIRAVKAHHAAAAHQPITSTPPPSTPSQKTTPPPNTTPQCYHSSSSRSPPSTPSGGLQNRLQTRRGDLTSALQLMASCSKPSAVSPPSTTSPPAPLTVSAVCPYLRVSELRLGTISYPLRAYMAAPDNALRDIIYSAVDSQTQDEIIQDLQSMNANTPLRHRRCAPDGALQIHPHHLRRHYHPPLLDRLQLWNLPLPAVPSESRGLHELLDSWPSRGRLHQAQVRPLLPLRPDPRDT
ncbi:hypothetical protein MTO96_043488 [Rhipicephalus appendiculatus]